MKMKAALMYTFKIISLDSISEPLNFGEKMPI